MCGGRIKKAKREGAGGLCSQDFKELSWQTQITPSQDRKGFAKLPGDGNDGVHSFEYDDRRQAAGGTDDVRLILRFVFQDVRERKDSLGGSL